MIVRGLAGQSEAAAAVSGGANMCWMISISAHTHAAYWDSPTPVNKVTVSLVQTIVNSQMVISVSLLKQTNNEYIHISSILLKTT